LRQEMVDNRVDFLAVIGKVDWKGLHNAFEHQEGAVKLACVGRVFDLFQEMFGNPDPTVGKVISGDFFNNCSIDFCNLWLL
jgi:hypothetical protein